MWFVDGFEEKADHGEKAAAAFEMPFLGAQNSGHIG